MRFEELVDVPNEIELFCESRERVDCFDFQAKEFARFEVVIFFFHKIVKHVREHMVRRKAVGEIGTKPRRGGSIFFEFRQRRVAARDKVSGLAVRHGAELVLRHSEAKILRPRVVLKFFPLARQPPRVHRLVRVERNVVILQRVALVHNRRDAKLNVKTSGENGSDRLEHVFELVQLRWLNRKLFSVRLHGVVDPRNLAQRELAENLSKIVTPLQRLALDRQRELVHVDANEAENALRRNALHRPRNTAVARELRLEEFERRRRLQHHLALLRHRHLSASGPERVLVVVLRPRRGVRVNRAARLDHVGLQLTRDAHNGGVAENLSVESVLLLFTPRLAVAGLAACDARSAHPARERFAAGHDVLHHFHDLVVHALRGGSEDDVRARLAHLAMHAKKRKLKDSLQDAN